MKQLSVQNVIKKYMHKLNIKIEKYQDDKTLYSNKTKYPFILRYMDICKKKRKLFCYGLKRDTKINSMKYMPITKIKETLEYLNPILRDQLSSEASIKYGNGMDNSMINMLSSAIYHINKKKAPNSKKWIEIMRNNVLHNKGYRICGETRDNGEELENEIIFNMRLLKTINKKPTLKEIGKSFDLNLCRN